MVSQRIQLLIEHFAHGKNTQFAEMLHTNEARIRAYLRGKAQPKYDFLLAVQQELGVSIDWLISGKGEMFITSLRPQANPSALFSAAACSAASGRVGVPLFNLDFGTGWGEGESIPAGAPYAMLSEQLARADFWCKMSDDSMRPQLQAGDYMALRACELDQLESGYTYAVVMGQVRTVRRLRRVPDEPELLHFIASNPQYDTDCFPLARIEQLYRVVGCLHLF